MNGRPDGRRGPGLTALVAFARRARAARRAPHLDGGLALARDKPGLDAPIVDVPPPDTLVLPLVGHRGRALVPTVRVGQRVARGETLAPGLPSGVDGHVVAIEPRPVAHPAGGDAPCIVVATDRSGSSASSTRPTLPALDALTLERLTACGVGGLGGAGFPTGDKLADAVTGECVHTLVVNGAECEPGIACDEALVPVAGDDVVAGALALARLAGAPHCLVVVESDKRAAREALRVAIDAAARRAGGATLRLLDVPPVYPSGAERLLLRLATGIDVPADERPSRHGLLCVNVATAAAAHRARLGEPSLERIVTVAGDRAARPCNARVTFGTPIADVLDATGQGTRARDTRRRVGGPLSGFDVASERVPVTRTTNRIALESPLPPTLESPCIRCAACSDVCPVNLLPQELLRHARSGDEAALDRGGLDACLECGCCDLVCPSSIELTATFRHARGVRLDARLRERDAELAEERFRSREARLARSAAAGPLARSATFASSRLAPSAQTRGPRGNGGSVRRPTGRPLDATATGYAKAEAAIGADEPDVIDATAADPDPDSDSGASAATAVNVDPRSDTGDSDSGGDAVTAALARAERRRRDREARRARGRATAGPHDP